MGKEREHVEEKSLRRKSRIGGDKKGDMLRNLWREQDEGENVKRKGGGHYEGDSVIGNIAEEM